jgi:hypothetical protein
MENDRKHSRPAEKKVIQELKREILNNSVNYWQQWLYSEIPELSLIFWNFRFGCPTLLIFDIAHYANNENSEIVRILE